MDWNTLAAAFVGGISGGGLGSAAALARLRADRRAALQERRWLDAEVVADVRQLLIDVNPERRGINLNPDKAVEAEKSAVVHQQSHQIDRELLKLAAGHPNTVVAECAHDLSGALIRAIYATEWHVRDLMTNRYSEDVLASARQAYERAMDEAKRLEGAIKKAGKH
jgi:hypothetical protein